MQAGTAHIWWLAIDDLDAGVFTRWLAVLDATEQARARRFVGEASRRQFIAAHALLRGMLTHAAGRPAAGGTDPERAAADWRFITVANGKPALHPGHGLAELEFNISHTNGAVACAMVRGPAIGVDIEDRDRKGRRLDVAHRYFAPAEIAQLRAAPGDEQDTIFFRFWTLKESYIKAVGKGLALPLDQFAFTLAPLSIAFDTGIVDEPGDWQFATVLPNRRHMLSVAVRHGAGAPVTLDWQQVSSDTIDRLTVSGWAGDAHGPERTASLRASESVRDQG